MKRARRREDSICLFLESGAAGNAAALTAHKLHTDAKFSFTTTQTVRDAADDSTRKIVKANIAEAERNVDSDLSYIKSFWINKFGISL